jgi:hypothetical protein
MKTLLAVALIPLSLLACRSNVAPIVDMQGVNVAAYNRDLTECRAYADQVATGRTVVRGAAGGAVVGAAVGAAVGSSDTAQRGAGAGAVIGAARGARQADMESDRVLRNCLRGRGYRVLN